VVNAAIPTADRPRWVILPRALAGPPPRHAAAYAEMLGVAPRFGSAHDELVIASADLARPPPTGSARR
jgi:hypothetical protein